MKRNVAAVWLMALTSHSWMLFAADPVEGLRTDIEFAKVAEERLLLDAYVPSGKGPFPTCILVHGGGFMRGDKQTFIKPLFEPLSKAGFAWFSINYRLAPQHRWPACADDVETAVRFVRAHAAEYKVDSKRIALIGESAGGHLVSYFGTRAGAERQVAAVVPFYAPHDLELQVDNRKMLGASMTALLGLTELNDAARKSLQAASPSTHLRKQMPPYLLIHGDNDTTVPYEQSLRFQQQMQAIGNRCDLVTIAGGGHGMGGWDKLNSDYRQSLIAWLHKTMPGSTDNPGGQETGAGLAGVYDGLDTGKYLGELSVLAKVTDTKVFTEGPCCDRKGHVYFTNTEASKILRWDGQQLSVFRADANAANGLLFDREGRLVACEGKAGRVTRTDMQTGQITVLCDQFGGYPLGSPNDLCFDRQGRIYFTSRLPNTDPAKGNVNAVYRIDPDGRVASILRAPDIHMPNGIVTSPDDKTLYLVESDPGVDRNRCILAFDLHADGAVSGKRTLISFYPGRSGDGMAIDAQGNLYVAAGLHKTRRTSETLATRPGIHVISPQGKLLAFLQTPEDTITNCRFGGADLKTLYVTSGSFLLSVRTTIPGKPLYLPEK